MASLKSTVEQYKLAEFGDGTVVHIGGGLLTYGHRGLLFTNSWPFLDTYDGSDSMTTEVEGMTVSTTAELEDLPATVGTELLYHYCSGSEFLTHVLEVTGASGGAIGVVKVLDGCRSAR